MATSDPSNETFTMLDTADLEAIGAHCQDPYCNQLDFLPFRCDSCHGTYCLDHRSETAHKCPRAGEWARNRRRNSVGRATSNLPSAGKPNLQTAQQCYEVKCKTFVNTMQNTGVRCERCNRTYCLKHRMQEDHDCKNVTPLGGKTGAATEQSNKDKIKFGFARIKSWGRSQQDRYEKYKPKPKPTSAAVRMAELNKLKKECKGDEKVPVEKRIYLHVEAEKETAKAKVHSAKLWFSEEWSVGRALDEAAKRLQVANVNNRVESEEQRLRIYHVEGGRLLEFSEKMGKVLANSNTIVLLRGVGPNDS
jgi:AN1-type zinc finger protein 1